jgi:hypothetical protein
LALVEAKAEALDRAVTGGLEDGRGDWERALKEWRSTVKLALEIRKELGLTPLSRARLDRDRVQAVAQAIDVQQVVESARQAGATA